MSIEILVISSGDDRYDATANATEWIEYNVKKMGYNFAERSTSVLEEQRLTIQNTKCVDACKKLVLDGQRRIIDGMNEAVRELCGRKGSLLSVKNRFLSAAHVVNAGLYDCTTYNDMVIEISQLEKILECKDAYLTGFALR